jgi:ATP phosphoribosyltransferase regulatory subunit
MIPDGMRDILPPEAAELRVLEDALRRIFTLYGYGEVRTPALEFAQTLEQSGDEILTVGYRLNDGEGNILMPPSDLTVPAVRLAVERLDDEPLPLRLWYLRAAVRWTAPRGGQDGEVLQAGAELVGLQSAAADAECVILLCDALSAAGLRDFKVSLGTAAFHGAVVEALALAPEQRVALLAALADHDYPLLESILGRAGADDEVRRALERSRALSGGRAALGQARRLAAGAGPAMEAAIDHLEAVADLVDEAGFENDVAFDFGLFKALEYYTGLVFEAYAPGVGFPIATGGRYDRLAAAFGRDLPAVGFSITVDRLHEALVEQHTPPVAEQRPLSFAGGLDEPGHTAALRGAGVAVFALPSGWRPLPPPSLSKENGQYLLEHASGEVLRGSWRDVARALGVA